MNFESFNEFIQMGRHGPYVWSAYGIAVLLLILNIALPLRARKKVLAAHARQRRREASTQRECDRVTAGRAGTSGKEDR